MSEQAAQYAQAGANFSPDALERGEGSFTLNCFDAGAKIAFTGLASKLSPEEIYALVGPLSKALIELLALKSNEEIHSLPRVG